jgi:hypothetical protein
MRFIEFGLFEGYKEVTQKFAQEADLAQVKDMIIVYRDLVDRNQVQGDERNIDWWGKQGWANFERFVSNKSKQKSKTQQKKNKDPGKSYTLAESNEWLIVVPLDKDASCFHGRGTDWCTTKRQHDYFEEYFRDNNVTLIYFLQKKTGAKWACAVHMSGHEEWFDINDNAITNGEFSRQTGIPLDVAMKYVSTVSDQTSNVTKKTNKARRNMKTDLEIVQDKINNMDEERDPEIEAVLIKHRHPDLVEDYILAITDNGDATVDLDQEMQTLVVAVVPQLFSVINNMTEETIGYMISNHSSLIDDLVYHNRDMVIQAITDNPEIIPEPGDTIGRLDKHLQKLFIEHDPLWIMGFSRSPGGLDPKLAAQKDIALGAFFVANPDVYAVVSDPGLTDLRYLEHLTARQYKDASDLHGHDAFEVIDRKLNII